MCCSWLLTLISQRWDYIGRVAILLRRTSLNEDAILCESVFAVCFVELPSFAVVVEELVVRDNVVQHRLRILLRIFVLGTMLHLYLHSYTSRLKIP